MIKELSILIPVYNSSENLCNFIEELIKSVSKKFKVFEIILVDDCSYDNSWENIETLCSKYNYIKGIQLRKNVGQHNAIFAGLNHCEGEIILTMDDDGQNSPESIEDLVIELKKGYDVCYANYRVKKTIKLLQNRFNV